MASGEIACSISALGSDISQIESAHKSVEKYTADVMNRVNALNGMWKGSAHDVFTSSFTKDYENIKTLCETIQNIIECLNYAKKEYANCENQVQQEIASINI